MILNRNQPFSQVKVQTEGEADFLRTVEAKRFINPYVGQKVTPRSLVLLLVNLHQQKQLKLLLPFGAYIKGAVQLLEDLGSIDAVECMMLSAKYAKHPWSMKFVLSVAKEHYQKQDNKIENKEKTTEISRLLGEFSDG